MIHITRTIKLLSLFAFLLGSSGQLKAQTTLSIGSGTATNDQYPIYAYYGYTYSQSIYTAAELTAAGASVGTISQIGYYFNSSSGTTGNSTGWTVYIGHTNKTSFANSTDWEAVGTLTQSYSGNVTFPAAGNWMTLTLTTPFQWNGVDNIIIAIDENTPSYTSSISWGTYTSSSGDRTMEYYSDYNNPNPTSPPSSNNSSTTLPLLQLGFTAAADCGTPVHGATTASSTETCPGSGVTLGLDQSYFYNGTTYSWEQNDGSGWTTISGATDSTYSIPSATQEMMYRATVGCTLSGTSEVMDAVTVSIFDVDTVHVSSTSVATCSGEPATIVASNVATYSWSPATGLTPSATEDTVFLLPSSPTVYTVTGTDLNGCITTASVNIQPVTSVSAGITTNPTENCSAGNLVTFALTGIPTNISNGGNWEYRFIGVDGTVVQDWSTTDNYTFIPAMDSVYAYYYQLRSTSCPADHLDSAKAEIAIGFGADIDLIHYDCNTMGGTISLSDVFGQPLINTVYENAFNSSADLSSVTLSGAAVTQADRIQLTASASSQSGYAMITNTNALITNNAMNVKFVITADQPLDNFGTGGGDGITYSFGDDATPSGSGNTINGRGTKLRLSFDSADNSGENGNVKGIYLVYGWTGNNAFGPSSSAVLAYSNNISWKGAANVPVEMNIDVDGKATVIVGGVTIFENIQLPAAYMTADATNWKHLFQAATGGDALHFTVADVDIRTIALSVGLSQTSAMPATWQQTHSFTDLLPGTYHVWIAKSDNSSCSKDIATVEILNNNPVVDLGNDTTICSGQPLTLDAGNPGAVYTWSGTNAYTQTYDVSESGDYVVNVTDTNGCSAIGSIQVTVQSAPAGTAINVQENSPSVFLSVTGAQNTDTYNWNFGDGNTLADGPASVAHSYAASGHYTVTVELVNECGSTTLTQTVANSLGLAENTLSGVNVFPNPATNLVTITSDNNSDATATVYAATGQLVIAKTAFNGTVQLNVADLMDGMYLVHIQSEGKTAVVRLAVQ